MLGQTAGQCARYHCNTHVVSQIRESCQMLSTCHRILDGVPGTVRHRRGDGTAVEEVRQILPSMGERDGMWREEAAIYWECYVNHPCNVWLRQSPANYSFLAILVEELNSQFILRFHPDTGRSHGSYANTYSGKLENPPANMPAAPGLFTPLPLVMPEPYRRLGGIAAYRDYYLREKGHLLKADYISGVFRCRGYGRSPVPEWVRHGRHVIGKKLT